MKWLIFLFNLIIPFVMIISGRCMFKNTRESISKVFGYRTPMSMKNIDTWKFANEYCGKLWWKIGWILLIISFLGQLLFFKIYNDLTDITNAVACTIQCVIVVVSIIPVEIALKRTFNKDGSRK